MFKSPSLSLSLFIYMYMCIYAYIHIYVYVLYTYFRRDHLSNATCLTRTFSKCGDMKQILLILDATKSA